MKCTACGFDEDNSHIRFDKLDLFVEVKENHEINVDMKYERWNSNKQLEKVWIYLYRCPKCGTVRAE